MKNETGVTMNIDWTFISKHEGHRLLYGYVPSSGKSGVTIATGVDIGQRSVQDLERWHVPPDLLARLSCYCGLTGAAAVAALQHNPLTVAEHEAEAIDRAAAGPIFETLRAQYDRATAHARFDDLPAGIQTALASVAYQYGANLARRTPKFWAMATRADWDACIRELENFGDRYPTRRRAEAALIRNSLSMT